MGFLSLVIMVVVGACLGPHVLQMALRVVGSQWKLPADFEWAPYVVGALFSGATVVAFAILFLCKSFLRRLVEAYKNTAS